MPTHVLQLSLLLICFLSGTYAAGILPQYGLWPQQDFLFDMCAPAAPGQQKGPWPVRVNDLCTSFGLNDPTKAEQACEVVQLLKMMLASPSAAPLTCQAEAIPPPPEQDKDGVLLPLPLPDLRGSISSSSSSRDSLPELLSTPQTAALLRAEGPSHLWLYKHVQRLAAWAPCDAVGQPTPWQHPPGWQLLQVLNVTNDLKGYKLAAKSLPFAAILRQNSSPSSRAACRRALRLQQGEQQAYISVGPAAAGPLSSSSSSSSSSENDRVLQQHKLCSGDRLVVLLRGTASAFEWTYNLNYTMTSDDSYGQGKIHSGFHTVAEEVWAAGLQQQIQQQLAAGGISNVMFAGHSLGGAAAAVLAAKTQKLLAAATNPAAAAAQPAAAAAAAVPIVTAVMFGAPNVGDADFAADFNTRINARNIEYVADIVPQLPCAGHMPVCATGSTAAAAAAGPGVGSANSDSTLSESDAAQSENQSEDGSWGNDMSDIDGLSESESSWDDSSSSRSSRGLVSYARLGGRLQLEAMDMPLQQNAWRQLSTYRQDDFCDNLQSINALAQATHSCSYMCHLSHTAGQDRHWCMLWPVEGGEFVANATYCQHGRSNLFPSSPLFPPMA